MAPQSERPRFAVRAADDRPAGGAPYGAWWPRSRVLADQLGALFTSWPAQQPRINRVLFSPPDWDDRPRKVLIDGHWVKTGNFPGDDTHLVTLSLSDGSRRTIEVIAPDTTAAAAGRILDKMAAPAAGTR